MDADRWRKIEAVYHSARSRPPDERAAHLAEACQGDPELQREVESLLDQDVSRKGTLDRPAWEVAPDLLKSPPQGGPACDMVGQTVSHYHITEKLGEGGMGVVYKAHDTKLERPVALKFLAPNAVENPERKARFAREAKAAARLDHPNICPVYEINEVGGRTFLAMAFLEGQTVQDKIQQRPLKLEEAFDIAIQTAQGLQAAHESEVVHRDVKSANLMVNDRGEVKVMDFGLAQVGDRSQLTDTGTTLGTPAYMSPEQALAQPTDRRTDIWSLGVVLYEMVTGQLPFRGEVQAAVVYAVVNSDHEPPTALRSGLPVGLDHIIEKALPKDRDDRYQHVDDILVDLRALRRSLETDEAAKISPPRARVRKKTKVDRRVVLGTVTAAALAAVAIGIQTLTSNEIGTDEPIDSLAVLPFVNASNNQETEYLSDGISESLITALSRVPGLKVKSRDAVFRYKGSDADVQQIGEELGVRALLKGRLEQRGELLSVSAELVDSHDGAVLWRNQYRQPAADFLAIEQAISKEISEQLRSHITGEQGQLPPPGPPARDPEAYRLYLRGRYELQRRGDGIAKSREFFQQAVAKDPGYAHAWAGLGDAFLMLGGWGIMRPEEAFPRSRAAARQAIEIDGTLAPPHATLGYTKTLYEWDWPGAEREFRRAIELDPEYGAAHHWFAFYWLTIGKEEEALASIRRAWELDPLSSVINAEVAYFSVFARQYDRGVREARSALEADSQAPSSYRTLARAYALLGNESETRAAVDQALQLSGRAPVPLSLGGAALARVGRKEEARKLLRELLDRAKTEYIFPALPALIYANLGEAGRAIEYYQEAVEERSLIASWLRDPLLDRIRSNPRFLELFERMGLEP